MKEQKLSGGEKTRLILRYLRPVAWYFAAGLLLSLLANLLHNRKLAWVLTLVVTVLWTLLLCVEYCCRSYFKSYFSVGFICTMAGNVVTGFGSTIPGVVLQRLPFIILALAPLVLSPLRMVLQL